MAMQSARCAGDATAPRHSYRPVQFFLLAFMLTWIPWLTAAHCSFKKGLEPYAFPFLLVGLLGPAVSAFLMICTSGSAALRADFIDRMVNFRRVNLPYISITILFWPVIVILAILVSLFFGQSPKQFMTSDGAMYGLFIAVMAGTLEELGWRGYGMDALRSQTGVLRAALLFGVLWALWHAPLFMINNSYHQKLLAMGPVYVVNFFASVVAGAVVINWLYYKHNRFIPVMIMLHFILDAVAEGFSATQFTKCIVTVLLTALAFVVVRFDPEFWREGKRDFIEQPQAAFSGTRLPA